MAEEKSNITFNISGGNNQILPNATEANQYFYGDQFAREALRKGAAEEPTLTDDERRLLIFCENEESLRNYVASLKACKTAADVGRIVVIMSEKESRLTEERIVKEEFIEKLLPFIINVQNGRGIANLRVQINNALEENKKIRKNRENY